MDTAEKPLSKSESARKAGSVKSERKRQQSAANLTRARATKERIFQLGLEADAMITEIGLSAYNKAVSIGVKSVKARISTPTPTELPEGA